MSKRFAVLLKIRKKKMLVVMIDVIMSSYELP